MLPEPLHTGDYELYEVAAPYGYVFSSEPMQFWIIVNKVDKKCRVKILNYHTPEEQFEKQLDLIYAA